jgi:hypothetical protein
MSISLRRKWLALLVCGKMAAACCVFGADTNESTPRVSVGIKVGAPLKKFVTVGYNDAFTDAQTKRYTIGPATDIELPKGFGIEVGAMYKRIDQNSASYTVLAPPSVFCDDGDCISIPHLQHHPISTVGRSWEFPVVGQYHFPFLRSKQMRPYVEGGFSYNHLSNIYGPYRIDFSVQTEQTPTINSLNRKGRVFGVGAQIKLKMIHVTPGLRYTRYRGEPGLPATIIAPDQNSLDFLVGFTPELKIFHSLIGK